VVSVVRLRFYFVCGGGSLCWSVWVCLLLGGKEGGGGVYEWWVFMRVSKIVLGNTVWFLFKWLFVANSVQM